MEWHLNIPKILHVYWGGSILPFLRYKTIDTFMKLNPDWQVMFWYPKHPGTIVTWETKPLDYKLDCEDFTPMLMGLPIGKNAIDFEDFGFRNTMSEVHKSDFLRYHLLTTYGGVWSDMDILFFKPITGLKVNKPENKDIETFVCICWYGHSNGFFLSAKGSKFFEKMASLSIKGFNANDYLCLGPTLCNNHYPTLESINAFSPALDIGMEAVYAHDCYQMIVSYGNNSQSRFTDDSIGIHWYAASQECGHFLKYTKGGTTNLPDNVLGRLLKNISYV